jgi:hypothetical protein
MKWHGLNRRLIEEGPERVHTLCGHPVWTTLAGSVGSNALLRRPVAAAKRNERRWAGLPSSRSTTTNCEPALCLSMETTVRAVTRLDEVPSRRCQALAACSRAEPGLPISVRRARPPVRCARAEPSPDLTRLGLTLRQSATAAVGLVDDVSQHAHPLAPAVLLHPSGPDRPGPADSLSARLDRKHLDRPRRPQPRRDRGA